ncbi:MAG: hypothetical protein ABMA02_11995 [Saprospiraceae bacterium]
MSKLPIEDKESMKWIRLMRHVNRAFNGLGNRVLFIADREGDFYEHVAERREENVGLLVRGKNLGHHIVFGDQRCQVKDLPNLLPIQGCYISHIAKFSA